MIIHVIKALVYSTGMDLQEREDCKENRKKQSHRLLRKIVSAYKLTQRVRSYFHFVFQNTPAKIANVSIQIHCC